MTNNITKTGRPPLSERLDKFAEAKNAWRKYNGGCVISVDVEATLKVLADSVRPYEVDLGLMVRAAVEEGDAGKRTLEQIWEEKLAEGATHVGIIDGVFHFFKGEEILPERNVPLTFSALPQVLQLHQIESEEQRQVLINAREEATDEMAKYMSMKVPAEPETILKGTIDVG